ncbi:hypothetical protein K6119_09905 [Paracrocinitomix mangrovi]|uniref:hypothetical protein n=1 Tax=Paracrocinitomix mangrovi TaxID=2862509 RepID=UPI001C8EACB5|nr:hypothetical protein [Paracrocinitomix mangrovi]UKN03804.1 hypothetical protein K6119_09905 [Paracrocinitomix mangrovi]
MSLYPITFEKTGFPRINVYEDYFSVESQETGKTKQYQFSDVKEIKIKRQKDSFWYKLPGWHQIIADIVSNADEPTILRIISSSGTPWEYEIPNGTDSDFLYLLEYLNSTTNS